MGRPPCCDKVEVKKGSWTRKEDIMLVSYVQEHGPGNWRVVPTITRVRRCNKSCRLKWANYLRPGIKRGNFTDLEEKMIIQLQALLGNKWAALASYLPERTDNDIKNYWNIHMKKKRKNLQSPPEIPNRFSSSSHSISRGQWERRLQADINTAKQALEDALSRQNTIQIFELKPDLVPESKPQGLTYASSIENIARLLKDWVPNTRKSEQSISSSNSINNPTSFESSSNSGLSRSDSTEASFIQGESKPDPIGACPVINVRELVA